MNKKIISNKKEYVVISGLAEKGIQLDYPVKVIDLRGIADGNGWMSRHAPIEIVLPIGIKASVVQHHYDEQGSLVSVEFEKPLLITSKSGEKVLVIQMDFDSTGEIEAVILFDKYYY